MKEFYTYNYSPDTVKYSNIHAKEHKLSSTIAERKYQNTKRFLI
jgi:hypothetical protein